MQAYIDAFNRADVGAVVALYAADATVEDPVGSPPKSGAAEIGAFYTYSVATGENSVSTPRSAAPTATAPRWPSAPRSAPSRCASST